MTNRDILNEFKQLIDGLSPDTQDQSLELLLLQMESESARQLRLSAIPHQFNVKILQALDPDLSQTKAEERCNEFTKYPFIYKDNYNYSIHEATRCQLFSYWLTPNRRSEFVNASQQLVEFFENLASHSASYNLDEANRSRMFHIIGVNQTDGFAEFEKLIQTARYQYQLSECESLIQLVHEYDNILEPAYVSWLTYYEGKLAYDLRHWDHAITFFKHVLDDGASNPELNLKTLNRLGMVYEAKREWAEAAGCYQTALRSIGSALEYRGIEARILHNLAITERQRGNQREAEHLLHESIELHQQTNDLSSLATAYNSLGTLYRELRDTKHAIEAYNKSLDFLMQSSDRFRSAQLYNNLGAIYADVGNWQKSEELFQRSLDIKKEAGDTLGQAKTLNNLVRVYQNLGNIEHAVAIMKQAITLFSSLHDRFNMATTKRNLAKLYHSIANDILAKQEFNDAINIFQQIEETVQAEKTFKELCSLDKKIGLPWWAWTSIIIISLFLLLIIFWHC